MTRIITYVRNENNVGIQACDCLSDCNSIEYSFGHYGEKMKVGNDSNGHKGTVLIYFADDEFLAYKRFETYGRVGLLSNIGGLLGLCLGISILSIVEIIYFFSLRIFDDFWHKSTLSKVKITNTKKIF